MFWKVTTGIAENVLFPNALSPDQAELVDRANLDALAGAPMYALHRPNPWPTTSELNRIAGLVAPREGRPRPIAKV